MAEDEVGVAEDDRDWLWGDSREMRIAHNTRSSSDGGDVIVELRRLGKLWVDKGVGPSARDG